MDNKVGTLGYQIESVVMMFVQRSYKSITGGPDGGVAVRDAVAKLSGTFF